MNVDTIASIVITLLRKEVARFLITRLRARGEKKWGCVVRTSLELLPQAHPLRHVRTGQLGAAGVGERERDPRVRGYTETLVTITS